MNLISLLDIIPKGWTDERTNQTLEQYSESIATINKTIGPELLPLAEFAYNNTPSATTGITPFFANKGYHLNLPFYPEHDLASAHAHDFVTDLDKLHNNFNSTLLKLMSIPSSH